MPRRECATNQRTRWQRYVTPASCAREKWQRARAARGSAHASAARTQHAPRCHARAAVFKPPERARKGSAASAQRHTLLQEAPAQVRQRRETGCQANVVGEPESRQALSRRQQATPRARRACHAGNGNAEYSVCAFAQRASCCQHTATPCRRAPPAAAYARWKQRRYVHGGGTRNKQPSSWRPRPSEVMQRVQKVRTPEGSALGAALRAPPRHTFTCPSNNR